MTKPFKASIEKTHTSGWDDFEGSTIGGIPYRLGPDKFIKGVQNGWKELTPEDSPKIEKKFTLLFIDVKNATDKEIIGQIVQMPLPGNAEKLWREVSPANGDMVAFRNTGQEVDTGKPQPMIVWQMKHSKSEMA